MPAPAEEQARARELAAALDDPDGAVAALEGFVRDAEAATEPVEKLVRLAEGLARGPDPATLATYAEPLAARILRDYRESRFRDVVRLVRAALALYLLAERWRELVSLLQLDRLSAEKLGDEIEAANALHDLGVLAGAAGVGPAAASDHAVSHTPQDAAPQAGAAVGVKVAAVDGSSFASYSVAWDRATPLTTAVWWYSGLGERAAEPLPYGRWEIVVEVGDREVDHREVVLQEAC